MSVGLPDILRTSLEAAAKDAGVTVAEEIRRRLQFTFVQDKHESFRPDLKRLRAVFEQLVFSAEHATGKRWDEDPSTACLLDFAIGIHLARFGAARDIKEIKLRDGFMRTNAVNSTDPHVIATVMEAVTIHKFRNDGRFDSKEVLADILARKEEEDS